MTSNDLKERSVGQNSIRVIESGLIQEYVAINSTFSLVLSEKRRLNIFPLPWLGLKIDLTEMGHRDHNSEIYMFCKLISLSTPESFVLIS